MVFFGVVKHYKEYESNYVNRNALTNITLTNELIDQPTIKTFVI